MMDLGKYAQVVLWSYAGALALILALIAQSLWQATKTRRALRVVEDRAPRAGVDQHGKPNG